MVGSTSCIVYGKKISELAQIKQIVSDVIHNDIVLRNSDIYSGLINHCYHLAIRLYYMYVHAGVMSLPNLGKVLGTRRVIIMRCNLAEINHNVAR